ncbi:hypothetical protein [Thermodesulfitimonas autotrophica]|uniref:hypothetical protein n=1 Tax=Thermodesulfitimonas autotrophica TaxID=1894989 RepID=UPI000F4F64F0|nr:hypothetical protein [Thermodesulfitimonas autotrophica]
MKRQNRLQQLARSSDLTLRFRLGRFTRLIFVTSRPAAEIPRPFRERAREYGVRHIIAREDILKLPELLGG